MSSLASQSSVSVATRLLRQALLMPLTMAPDLRDYALIVFRKMLFSKHLDQRQVSGGLGMELPFNTLHHWIPLRRWVTSVLYVCAFICSGEVAYCLLSTPIWVLWATTRATDLIRRELTA